MLNNVLSQISKEDFDFLKKNGKRSSILFNFDFESIINNSWGFVKETIPDSLLKSDIENLIFLFAKDRGINLFLNDVSNLQVKEAMSFFLWLLDEIKSLKELESTYLVSEPDAKMLQAGINELDKFGFKNTLDNLAKGDVLKYDEIKKLPYHVIFDKQYMEVIKSKIEKKLTKIK